MKDPTRDDMVAFLTDQAGGAGSGLEFDIEEAIYWFANDYHGGQWSDLYAALCASEYKPGPCTRGPSETWLYDMLVSKYGEQ